MRIWPPSRAPPLETRCALTSFNGALVAHWKFDEPGPWFGDWSGHGNNLETDFATSRPRKVAGVDGEGLALTWKQDPGVATRLWASGAAFQTDGFGFSLWRRVLSRLSKTWERTRLAVSACLDSRDLLIPYAMRRRALSPKRGRRGSTCV